MRTRRTRWATLLAGVALLMAPALTPRAEASDKFIGQIFLFGGNFAPRNTVFCNGSLLPIAQNTAMFAILGTMYGGDGRTTFGVPNLQARAALHSGNGPGLSNVSQGSVRGAETATLTDARMPAHVHTGRQRCLDGAGNSDAPAGNVMASRRRAAQYRNVAPDVDMAGAVTLDNTGGGQSFSIRDPYLALNFCIVISGIFPPRN